MWPTSETLQILWDQLLAFLPKLGVALFVFLVALALSTWVSKGVRKWMESRAYDSELIVLLRMLTRSGILLLGTVVALEQLTDGKLGALIAGLGVAGFTIGFALQDVAKNFIAGIMLLLQQPFGIGDSIEVAGYGGKVLEITLRTTEMRTWDGRRVFIPNGDVFLSPIVNFSRATKRRVELTIGVAGESDLDHVARTTHAAISAIPGVLDDPAPQVVFDRFGDSAIEFRLFFWVDIADVELLAAKDAAVREIKTAFEREGIDMPYPTVSVLMPER